MTTNPEEKLHPLPASQETPEQTVLLQKVRALRVDRDNEETIADIAKQNYALLTEISSKV